MFSFVIAAGSQASPLPGPPAGGPSEHGSESSQNWGAAPALPRPYRVTKQVSACEPRVWEMRIVVRIKNNDVCGVPRPVPGTCVFDVSHHRGLHVGGMAR